MLRANNAEHSVVYRRDDEFSAWPANGALYRFADDELALVFTTFACDYQAADSVSHGAPGKRRLIARSTDGGRSWGEAVDFLTPDSVTAHTPDTVFDPADPDFCLFASGRQGEAGENRMEIFLSRDRGHTWHGPGLLDGSKWVYTGVRTSPLLRPDGVLLQFANVNRVDDELSSYPAVYGSPDGGKFWSLIGEVELTPKLPCGIMAAPALLPSGDILMVVRRDNLAGLAYTDAYASSDLGRTWRHRSRVNEFGAPASLTLLPDGRLVCVYGYRRSPGFGVRARISGDKGHTWGTEIVLRDDGGSGDLGYPRTALLSDGALVTAYYFNRQDDPIQLHGGVRHIAATRWTA